MNDLIRQAIAAEADERVDSRTVLANLHKAKKRKPLGLIVGVVTLTAAAAATAVIVPTVIKKTEAAPPAVSPTSTTQNVYLLGTDDYNRIDAIVIAHLAADGSVSTQSISREIVFRPGAKLSPAASLTEVVASVGDMTGVKADHYAVMKMADFGKFSEAVGGVEVCLNAATSDPNSGANFPAGKSTLSGDRALAFLRQRIGLPKGDWDRVVRQRHFLAGVATKITKDNAVALAREVGRSIEVDPGWDVLEFAQMVRGPIKVGDLLLSSPTPNGQTPGPPVQPTASAHEPSCVD